MNINGRVIANQPMVNGICKKISFIDQRIFDNKKNQLQIQVINLFKDLTYLKKGIQRQKVRPVGSLIVIYII